MQDAIEDTLPLVRRAKLLQQGLRILAGDARPGQRLLGGSRGRGVYLQATPIDVSQTLASRLFEQLERWC